MPKYETIDVLKLLEKFTQLSRFFSYPFKQDIIVKKGVADVTKNEEIYIFCSKLVINSQEVPQTKNNKKIHHFHVKLTIFYEKFT